MIDSHRSPNSSNAEKNRSDTMAKSPSHSREMGGFYLIFWLRNYPHATGTRPNAMLGNMTKHPMFDLIPLPGPRRKVPDVERDTELIGELLAFSLPQPIATGIAPPAIGRDEDRVGLRIRPLAYLPPPAPDGCNRTLGGVVIDPHTAPAAIVRWIVHPIGTN